MSATAIARAAVATPLGSPARSAGLFLPLIVLCFCKLFVAASHARNSFVTERSRL